MKYKRWEDLREALEVEVKADVYYSDWMIEFGQKHLSFVEFVQGVFDDMLINSKDPTEKYGDYQFATMSNVKRRMIHELAAIYGFECISYNPEPYRYCHVFINGTQNITLPRVNFF